MIEGGFVVSASSNANQGEDGAPRTITLDVIPNVPTPTLQLAPFDGPTEEAPLDAKPNAEPNAEPNGEPNAEPVRAPSWQDPDAGGM